MKRFLLLLLIASPLFIISCTDSAKSGTDGVEAIELLDGPEFFGEKIDPAGAISLASLQEQLKGKDSVIVTLEAQVEGVCQAKGCWMNLVSDDMPDEPIFVKFKDYAFFMPKDIAGRTVIANGVAYKEVTSVDELRHYAEDGGASKEEIAAIDTPKEELKFMARGVKLLAEK